MYLPTHGNFLNYYGTELVDILAKWRITIQEVRLSSDAASGLRTREVRQYSEQQKNKHLQH